MFVQKAGSCCVQTKDHQQENELQHHLACQEHLKCNKQLYLRQHGELNRSSHWVVCVDDQDTALLRELVCGAEFVIEQENTCASSTFGNLQQKYYLGGCSQELLNDPSVISAVYITEWHIHLYNMTIFFKLFQMFLDYTYDFLIICMFIPQNVMLKELLENIAQELCKPLGKLSLSGESPFLHTHATAMCPVLGVMHSTTQVLQRGILQNPTVNSHCLEDKTEMAVSLH